jgi:hypothetical protein
VRFDTLIQRFLKEEKNQKKENYENLPWSIEITKDPNRSTEYNELGDLIIKLFELRSKVK